MALNKIKKNMIEGLDENLTNISEQLSDIALNLDTYGISSTDTDVTETLIQAVSDALSQNRSLTGKGIYKVSGNIPNLHDINIVGDVAIQRGEDIFYTNPEDTQTSIFYVGFGGLASNDGLTKDKPMTFTKVKSILQNLGSKASRGQWRVQFVEGTIKENGQVFNNMPYFSKPLQIWGVWDGVTRKAIWDGSNSNAAYCIRADGNNANLNIEFRDMKFINWNNGTSNSGAIVTWQGVNVRTDNCEFDSCAIGYWGRGGYSTHYSDVINNCSTWGYSFQYSHTASVGSSIYTRNKITNCEKGVFVGRTSVAHVDYTDFENNKVNIQAHQKSRVASVQSHFKSWTDVSHWLQGDSIFEDDGSTWDGASITDLTPIYRFDNGSSVPAIQTGGLPYRVAHYIPDNPYIHTGTTEKFLLSGAAGFSSPLRIPKYLLYNKGTIEINVACRLDVSGTNGQKTLTLAGAGSSASYEIASIVIPAGGALGELTFKILLKANGTGIYKAEYSSGVSSVNRVTFGGIPASTMSMLRDKTPDQTLWRLYCTLANASDSVTLSSITTDLLMSN